MNEDVRAIRIIHDEHSSLAAVLNGMLYLVRKIRDHRMVPDFGLLGAMVYYIDAFPERFHHPKEDKYLFKLLRIRCAGAAPLIDRLEEDHRVGAEQIRTLEQTLVRWNQGGERESTAFVAAVEAYAAFHKQHMEREENELLPLAKKHLRGRDWIAIDVAFNGHTDPLFGEVPRGDYDKLFQRILNLRILNVTPPPIGLSTVS